MDADSWNGGVTMKTNKKGRNRSNGAAFNTASSKANYIRSRLTMFIVRIAVWGLIPAKLATFLIQREGLLHE
jgi:hypothetical protein